MKDQNVRIFPLGDSALTVEFGNSIKTEFNKKALALARAFDEETFPGFIEAVPAYASTTVFYDLGEVKKRLAGPNTAYDAVKHLTERVLADLRIDENGDAGVIEIPVSFDADSALDLDVIAETHNFSPEEVINIFLSRTYRVFMIGFLPGFSYMGEVDRRIATPRKESPRTVVPKGSVGIAGRQTGVYSLESPGGWQIIGRTDVDLFTPDADSPTLLQAGDEVRFIPPK